jgi:hypothetical protein
MLTFSTCGTILWERAAREEIQGEETRQVGRTVQYRGGGTEGLVRHVHQQLHQAE